MEQQGNLAGRFLRPLIDMLFWPIERDHCRLSFESELLGQQLPCAYRSQPPPTEVGGLQGSLGLTRESGNQPATLQVVQKTDVGMLPQFQPLEAPVADKLRVSTKRIGADGRPATFPRGDGLQGPRYQARKGNLARYHSFVVPQFLPRLKSRVSLRRIYDLST
jgi:hypothetical protein